MVVKNTESGGGRGGRDDIVESSGSVSVSDSASKSDYLSFVWDKLNAIDGRMADLSEKYGRFDEKLGTLQTSIEKIDGKVSKIDGVIRWVKAVVVVGVFIIGGLLTIYKLIEPHLGIIWK